MSRYIKWVFAAVFLLGFPLLWWSCGTSTSSPAAPVPPVEVPSPVALKFVEYPEFAIDIDTVTTSATPSINVSKLVGTGPYEDDILESIYAEESGAVLADVMQGLGQLEIPIGDTVTTFEGTFTQNNIFNDYQDTTFTIKIDFADFDLDGDGTTEGCSGHTNEVPICARAWIKEAGSVNQDFKRYFAWVFEEYPTATNSGKSRFRIQYEFYFIQSQEVTFNVEFDQRDPENKDLAVRSGRIVSSSSYLFKDALYLSQVGPDASAIKLLNLAHFDEPSFILMQWKEGSDRWSGSKEAPDGNYTGVCVEISTAQEAPVASCDIFGITVGDDFLTEHPDSAVQFHDFQALPTF